MDSECQSIPVRDVTWPVSNGGIRVHDRKLRGEGLTLAERGILIENCHPDSHSLRESTEALTIAR
jgi:hypothetical protein